MAMRTFFLEDIRKEAFRDTLSPEEQATLDRYLEEMDQDLADGEMDIEWVETGRGYYAHVRYLDGLADERARDPLPLDPLHRRLSHLDAESLRPRRQVVERARTLPSDAGAVSTLRRLAERSAAALVVSAYCTAAGQTCRTDRQRPG